MPCVSTSGRIVRQKTNWGLATTSAEPPVGGTSTPSEFRSPLCLLGDRRVNVEHAETFVFHYVILVGALIYVNQLAVAGLRG